MRFPSVFFLFAIKTLATPVDSPSGTLSKENSSTLVISPELNSALKELRTSRPLGPNDFVPTINMNKLNRAYSGDSGSGSGSGTPVSSRQSFTDKTPQDGRMVYTQQRGIWQNRQASQQNRGQFSGNGDRYQNQQWHQNQQPAIIKSVQPPPPPPNVPQMIKSPRFRSFDEIAAYDRESNRLKHMFDMQKRTLDTQFPNFQSRHSYKYQQMYSAIRSKHLDAMEAHDKEFSSQEVVPPQAMKPVPIQISQEAYVNEINDLRESIGDVKIDDVQDIVSSAMESYIGEINKLHSKFVSDARQIKKAFKEQPLVLFDQMKMLSHEYALLVVHMNENSFHFKQDSA